MTEKYVFYIIGKRSNGMQNCPCRYCFLSCLYVEHLYDFRFGPYPYSSADYLSALDDGKSRDTHDFKCTCKLGLFVNVYLSHFGVSDFSRYFVNHRGNHSARGRTMKPKNPEVQACPNV